MLQELTDFGEENTIVLKPRVVLTDLELAAINANKSEFPEVVNKVCFFSFWSVYMEENTS